MLTALVGQDGDGVLDVQHAPGSKFFILKKKVFNLLYIVLVMFPSSYLCLEGLILFERECNVHSFTETCVRNSLKCRRSPQVCRIGGDYPLPQSDPQSAAKRPTTGWHSFNFFGALF